jgi:hypothetical protein
MLWSRFIGIAFIGVAAWNIFKGRFVTSDDYGNRDLIDRKQAVLVLVFRPAPTSGGVVF